MKKILLLIFALAILGTAAQAQRNNASFFQNNYSAANRNNYQGNNYYRNNSRGNYGYQNRQNFGYRNGGQYYRQPQYQQDDCDWVWASYYDQCGHIQYYKRPLYRNYGRGAGYATPGLYATPNNDGYFGY